jgi:hypothetical protein
MCPQIQFLLVSWYTELYCTLRRVPNKTEHNSCFRFHSSSSLIYCTVYIQLGPFNWPLKLGTYRLITLIRFRIQIFYLLRILSRLSP